MDDVDAITHTTEEIAKLSMEQFVDQYSNEVNDRYTDGETVITLMDGYAYRFITLAEFLEIASSRVVDSGVPLTTPRAYTRNRLSGRTRRSSSGGAKTPLLNESEHEFDDDDDDDGDEAPMPSTAAGRAPVRAHRRAVAFADEPVAHHGRGDIVWVNVANASEAELQQIGAALRLHEVTIEDTFVECREKVEVFGSQYALVVSKELHYRPGSTALEHVLVKCVACERLSVTFHSGFTHAVPEVIYRYVLDEGGVITSPFWVAYAYLDQIAERLVTFVNGVVEEASTLDDLVLMLGRSEQSDLLRRIATARRKLASIRSSLWTKKDTLEQLLKLQTAFSSEHVRAYLRDVLDHVISMLERLHVAHEVSTHLEQLYLTRLNVETATVTEEMSSTMRSFSAVATIFLPLSVLAGLFGMNVRVPAQDDTSTAAFWAICAFMVFGACCLFVFLRKRKYL